MRRRTFLLFAGCAALLAMLPGCGNLAYYLRSVEGQLDLVNRQRPVEAWLADQASPPELKRRLALASEIRDFASLALGLPENASYRSYADLERPYVVWNVFAAPAFAIEPVVHCFPFAGCVGYKGFFSQAQADAFAASLAAKGHDVHVAGVPAYSTLGWFSDPLLNTFIHYPQAELARLVFHELAHQVAYVRDDSVFNESFAVAVELEGVRRWLALHGSEAERHALDAAQRRRAEVAELIGRHRARLVAHFAAAGDDAERLAGKRRIYRDLTDEYERLKTGWGGFRGYDRLLAAPNNAVLASFVIYTDRVPAFQALLRLAGNDLPRFYQSVKQLAASPKAQRDAVLEAAVRDADTAAVTRDGKD